MAEVVFDHVTRIYPGNDKPSVDDLNLDIKDGEFLVLVGPSGCGKSTTLRMLAGLEEVNKGRILIGGKDVTTMQPKDRDIAMVFQNYALYPHMTVADNMGFALKIAGTPAKIGEDTVDLPAEAVNKLTAEDNNQIVVGFRPEDASLAAPDDANAFSLKVMNVEDLGSDGYIYGNILTDGSSTEASTMMSDQNKLTTIRVNPRALPKVGDTVKIKIDPSKMHLFAPSTELRLN